MAFIELKEVCLDYLIKTGPDSIKKTAIHLFNNYLKKNNAPFSLKSTSYRALNNINLMINKGDRIGVLGRNGAGKSTLLRVLAKIYKPNIGKVNTHGKISNLFDVSLGMNTEATGYENIFNLAILRGASKKQVHHMIEDIEEFTELGEFLYSPVRTYSSGMQIKLAFAVAIAIPPEIMLIDEIIGVGDMHFMNKALNRLESTIEKSQILVLTSHSNDIIKKFCNKVMVLDGGEIQFLGNIEEGLSFYQDNLT